ncbi:MAG TPA: HAD-IIIA family hydrolase [Bacteroidetes bacterium]|nr:HAD-IIIA family hydrolase [Bacteroidota bacterium]
MNLLSNVHRLLHARGLDRYRMAKALGLPHSRPVAWESGDGPTLDEVVGLADYFGVSIDRLVRGEIREPIHNQVKLLVLDVDGVLTDGGMYVTESGDEMKKFHTRDGRGIIEVQKRGIEVAILSGGMRGEAVFSRAERLGISRIYVGTAPKTQILEKWIQEIGIDYTQVAYVGDDLNDLGVLQKAGFTACPANAVRQVKDLVDIILQREGGQGCVREFIEDYIGL